MSDKKKIVHIIPPMLTVVIMLIVYIIKGVYPFGDSDVAYYDMNAQYVPNYARNYEILHGQDSLMFDWLAGGGMDMTGAVTGYSLHPVNWVFFVLKPDYVLKFMALFLVIKLMFASLSMSVYLKKMYDPDVLLHVTLCMIYTFSGYVAQQYVNIFFLDSMMMFPLVILSVHYMINKGNGIPYLLLMIMQLVSSWYLGYMELFFLLFYSFGLVCVLSDKNKKRISAARVGIFTVLSIMISAVIILPAILKAGNSSRFSGLTPPLYLVFGTPNIDPQDFDQKLFISFNTEMAAALCTILIFKRIIKKKLFALDLAFHLYVLMFTFFPLLNESTHLLWHMGSYAKFPYRCGYILVFAAIELIAYIWKYENEEPIYDLGKKKIIFILFIGTSVITGILLLIKMSSSFIGQGIYKGYGSYKYAATIYGLFTLVYLLLILFANKKTRETAFAFISLTSAGIAMVCFIAPTNNPPKLHYLVTEKPVQQTISIRNNVQFDNDYLSRVKVLYPVLTRNYSQLLGMPSLNQWLTDATPEYHKAVTLMGYGANFACNYDWGGTAFSDALLNNRKAIVYGDSYVPEQLYSEYSKIDEFSVYDMKYTLPFGLLDDDKWLSLDTEENGNIENIYIHKDETEDESSENDLTEYEKENTVTFDWQIQIAAALMGNTDTLLQQIPSENAKAIDPVNPDYKHSFEYNVHIDKPSVLYVSLAKYTYATVNGVELKKPYFEMDERNPTEDEGIGIMLVGFYDAGEDVKICVCNQSGVTNNDYFALLDLEALQELCDRYAGSSASSYKAGKNRLDITADVESGKNYMFLPLEYLEGWKAEVNGEKAEIYPVMNGAFMALKLPDGHCDIVMKYMNPNIRKGAVISLVGLALVIAMILLKKKGKDIAEIPFVANTAYYALNITAVGTLIIMYIVPLLVW